MNLIEILGVMAGSLTTISFLPQVIKTWKEKSAKDLSLSMFLLFASGVLLWLSYGLFIGNAVIIFFNAITFVLASFILYFKLKFR